MEWARHLYMAATSKVLSFETYGIVEKIAESTVMA